MIKEQSNRNKEIFRHLVEAYVETGEPVGSLALSNRLNIKLSSSTIRAVMSEFEQIGLLFSPHVSSGRIPTPLGLRFFVDGILEIGDVSKEDRVKIYSMAASTGDSLENLLSEAIEGLSGLSNCAGLVLAQKNEFSLSHIEFIGLSKDRVLVVIVTDDGLVENRVLETPNGWTQSSLIEATNYLNVRIKGKNFQEIREEISSEENYLNKEIDILSRKLVQSGVAAWSEDKDNSHLIVRGMSKLLDDLNALEDLEQIRKLFDSLEKKQVLIQLLDMTKDAQGVRIYLGAENDLFENTGCTAIVSPYINGKGKIIGAIGVVGPSRLNYARIIPMVDYTAKILGHTLNKRISNIRKRA